MDENPEILWYKIEGSLTIYPKLILLSTLINTLRERKELLDELEIYHTYETLRKKCNLGISAKSFREWLYLLITCGFVEKVKRGCKIYFKLAFPPELVREAMLFDPQMKDLLLSELNETPPKIK